MNYLTTESLAIATKAAKVAAENFEPRHLLYAGGAVAVAAMGFGAFYVLNAVAEKIKCEEHDIELNLDLSKGSMNLKSKTP